jgi:hypothetical protein
MGAIKNRYKDTKLNTSNKMLVDSSTGEIIEIGNINVMTRTSTGEISINSKTFVYLDTDKLSILLANDIKQVDLALLLTISNNMLLGSNICLKNDDNPHTTSSIANLIGNTDQAVKLKLNRLTKLGVLHYGIMKENKRLGKVYIVNPHIIRKGVKLKGSLALIFDDIKRRA